MINKFLLKLFQLIEFIYRLLGLENVHFDEQRIMMW